jgi:hypothetical protein
MQFKNALRSSREGYDGIKTTLETYSGYFVNKSGEEFVFAVMINNPLDSPAGIVEKFLTVLMLKE